MAHFAIHCFSDILQMSVNLNVILPQRTTRHGFTGSTPDGKFPVLYLLHGGSGDDSDYVNFTNIVRYADDNKIAVIMPNDYNACYTDSLDGSIKY